MKDKIPGGLADKAKNKKFDKDQLAKGKKVEMEHTNDPDLALEIARDHLMEDPKYYDHLLEMEAKNEKKKKSKAEFSSKRFAIDMLCAVAEYCDEKSHTSEKHADRYITVSERLTKLAEDLAVEGR